MKVHTEAVQFKADEKLLEFIEKKLGKLETFFDRIIEINVTLKLENAGQVKDKIAEVRVSVPGEVIFASDVHKNFEGAIEGVLDTLKRQLQKYKEKHFEVK
jgi:putative sigma-54 modulation protein